MQSDFFVEIVNYFTIRIDIFDNVLLVDSDGHVTVGTPKVEGAKVEAKVLQHLKDDKVLVFRKIRRKGMQTLNGHLTYLTKIEIENIIF